MACPQPNIRAGMETWVFLLTAPRAFHLAASRFSTTNHGCHFRRAMHPSLTFISGGMELPQSQEALSLQVHTYCVRSMSCFSFGEHFITSLLERKKKRGQKKVYWIGKEIKFTIYTEINPVLWKCLPLIGIKNLAPLHTTFVASSNNLAPHFLWFSSGVILPKLGLKFMDVEGQVA